MSTAERSIEVNVGVTTAYDEGTRFDSFPRWLEGVASVDGIDDTHLRWVAKVKNEVADESPDLRGSRGAATLSPGPAVR